MIQRHRADGFEIAVEDRIDDGGAEFLAGEIGKTGANRVRPARDVGEADQPDLGPALPRQHADQIGIVHRVERMVLQRAFIERHGADEEVAAIDGAAGFRKGRA